MDSLLLTAVRSTDKNDGQFTDCETKLDWH